MGQVVSQDPEDRTRAAPAGGPGAPATPAAARHFEKLQPLGAGAMGVVHLARDVVLGRKVALKSLLPAAQREPAMLRRFVGEMRITAQLDHPHIVPVYGVEEEPRGELSYAMKVVEGRELEAVLLETQNRLTDGKPLDERTSLEHRLEIFTKVCDAMAYAHDRGVIHRDLKPTNIMIGAFNEVYVMDWGIARHIGPEGRAADEGAQIYERPGNDKAQMLRTSAGDMLGTPLYMSPEQMLGENDKLDGRSDQFTLGLILQELVVLEHAIPGETMAQVIAATLIGKRKPMVSKYPGVRVPKELVAIVDKATQRQPADRYPSVAALGEDVRRFLRGESVSAKPDDALQRVGRIVARHRTGAVFALVLLALAGVGATAGVWLLDRAQRAEQQAQSLRLGELQATSALRAQTLDDSLKQFERELARLAGSAATALLTQGPGEPVVPPERFTPGEGAPPGLLPSPFHGRPVSFATLATTLAPGTDPAIAEAQIGALGLVRDAVVRTMIDALPLAVRAAPPEKALAALLDPGGPIVRVTFVTTEGVRAVLPGSAEADAPKDARQDELHQRARSAEGVVWGAAAVGPVSVPTLPAAISVRGDGGQILGVIRLDIDPAKAITATLDDAAAEPGVSTLLVERSGKVVTQRRGADVAAEPEVLSIAAVREAIQRGESGVLQSERDGRAILVSYHPLSSVDWYLITIANASGADAPAAKPAARPEGGVSVPAARRPAAVRPTAAPAAAPAPPPPSASAPAPDASASAAPLDTSAPPGGRTRPPPRADPFAPWKVYQNGPPR